MGAEHRFKSYRRIKPTVDEIQHDKPAMDSVKKQSRGREGNQRYLVRSGIAVCTVKLLQFA